MFLPPLRIVTAVIVDARGWVLVVRKQGSTTFIQPGGKREPGEDALQTLARELGEELQVQLRLDDIHPLGLFQDRAVNEPGRDVRADAFLVGIDGIPVAGAEIAELAWIDPDSPHVSLAPLSARHILPAARTVLAARPAG